MRILMVEPYYKNKYPPLGLMKISTYHKLKGDKVIFYKGIMPESIFREYDFDRVYITSLFTFYYKMTVDTIKKYQELISSEKIFVGGILASLMPSKLREDIGMQINIIEGLLKDSELIGYGDNQNIDILPLDYSILDDIDYCYPAGDNYFAYLSRGCTNKCSFCAVPVLEPEFRLTNNIIEQIDVIKKSYGEKQNLLLLDNNILSFDIGELEIIANDIISLGFDKKTKFFPKLPFEDYLNKLDKLSPKEFAFQKNLSLLLQYLKDKQSIKKSKIYKQKYDEILSEITQADNKLEIIKINKEPLFEILNYYYKPSGRSRHVDFNQGIDARQLTREKMQILSKLPIEPFRLAFDKIQLSDIYINAVRLANEFGVNRFSNYILYNFEDRPEDLWERLRINIELVNELNIRIFSFPMRYAPVERIDRNYIGANWNKQYLSNIYAILNVTKGIVAAGGDFFRTAFGNNLNEYFEILSMPRDFVIYRKYFEDNDLTNKWRHIFNSFTDEEKRELLFVLSTNSQPNSNKVSRILEFYNIKKAH